MAGGDYVHDAFISYASEDRAWAELVHTRLTTAGLDVFLDADGLRVGERWDEGLQDAVVGSRHLVLLWSDFAEESDWVQREEALHNASRRLRAGAGRLLQVVLGGEPPRPGFQGVLALREHYRPGGPAEPPPHAIESTVAALAREIQGGQHLVNLVVLAANREELTAARHVEAGLTNDTLDDALTLLGEGFEAFLARYDDSERTAWKPFGDGRSVMDVLAEARAGLQAPDGLPVEWRLLNDELWSGSQPRTDVALDALTTERSVVVVDPLSVYVKSVADRLTALFRYPLRNDQAVFLTIGPYGPPPHADGLRSMLQNLAADLYEGFFEPPIPARRGAMLGIGLDDVVHVQRWLRRCLAAGTWVTPSSPMTSMGP